MKIRFLAAILFTFPFNSFCQSNKVAIEKAPGWIQPQQYDANATPPAGQESGYYYLLLDQQENTLTEERFQHYAYKVLTTEGIQGMSDIALDYDPAYEQLVLHSVTVRRGNTTINQMPKDIRPIQREQSIDRYMYDGSLTVMINLKDIHVNDIIEYSFTTRGFNPVFDGHISRKIYFNFSVPYEKSFTRLMTKSTSPLHLEYRNADVKPNIRNSGGQTDYSWTLKHMSGVVSDDNLPDWYDGNHRVLITDFDNWSEVAAWAKSQFELTAAELQSLKEKIKNKFHQEDAASYALDAIRFVQDEVRYLGFEDGVNSHKPHPPAAVFEQKFGDCKDKSLLLCAILRLNNIEASPVLTNTTLRDKISDELPSATAFNHCVVELKINDKLYYIDPTISNQGGTLETTTFPTYRKGLVIKEATRDLIDFPERTTPSEISEAQTFEIASLGADAIMNVRTTYTGLEADNIRSQFLNNSLESIQKNYLTFYGNLYPDLEVIDPLSKHDERRGNIFTVEEKYRIPSFWKQNPSAAEQMYCTVYPQTLENYFNIAKSTQRTSPYRLAYPVSYHHYIHIKLPMEWNLVPDHKSIETDSYAYEYLTRYDDREVSLQTHYETKRDFIPLQEFDKFVSDHQEMMDNLNYQLSYNKNLVFNKEGISWMAIGIAAASIAFGLWLAFRLFFYYDPKPLFPAVDSLPIGGWLILPALGLIISPLTLVYGLFQTPEVYNSQMWMNLIALKRYGLFSVVLVEHVYNIVMLPFSVVIAILYFKRRSSVPRLMTILLSARCLVAVVDAVISMQNDTFSSGSEVSRNLFQGIFAAAIWIPYFNISSRVKETFVTRVDDDDNDDSSYAVATQQSQGSTLAPGDKTDESNGSSII